MNTENDLAEIVGKQCIGAGAIPEHGCLMIFFVGGTLAVKVENGVLTWEAFPETVH